MLSYLSKTRSCQIVLLMFTHVLSDEALEQIKKIKVNLKFVSTFKQEAMLMFLGKWHTASRR